MHTGNILILNARVRHEKEKIKPPKMTDLAATTSVHINTKLMFILNGTISNYSYGWHLNLRVCHCSDIYFGTFPWLAIRYSILSPPFPSWQDSQNSVLHNPLCVQLFRSFINGAKHVLQTGSQLSTTTEVLLTMEICCLTQDTRCKKIYNWYGRKLTATHGMHLVRKYQLFLNRTFPCIILQTKT